MATTAETSNAELQQLAKQHLWMHFSRMGAYENAEVPIITRGDGCYVWDQHGKKYLDGLSSLFCTNIGHGRADVAQAGADQAKELGFFTNWSYAHPRSIELAAKIAELAPADLNRVFFTSGGSEAVESALKLARQYHKLRGNGTKYKVIARETAYHGTTAGCLTATGIAGLRAPFEPLPAGGCHVPNTNTYRLPEGHRAEDLAEAIAHRIEFEGPETVSAIILEPVQNAGGCFVPPEGYFQRVREIADYYDVLFISDEVICSWGRLGEWFGAQRYDYVPDMITTAKGITSAYAPMGAVIASEKVFEPFSTGTTSFMHGLTFGGHPVCAAVSLANIQVFEDEDILGNVRANEAPFRSMLEGLRDIPIVGDVRGAGYFHAIEMVKDQETKESFSDEESETLLRGYLSSELFERGLICRADDRGDPVIMLSPPLIAGPEQFEEIEGVLRPVLEEASRRMLG
ncbi:aspartate aminotransferase family protein [Conexibacter woesei]|uniref:aspartate aminotransferase family protein n=1 Tax=Conexibacter woesei TaxID=191495 RepID=UPI0004090782|nr:aspartate aminotransferase family protein [Conexibacter woesei]